ncbi:LysR family transcriptional regulator [Alteromonas sp. ASW11-36]|uniref:LysR family transcriptional regulator n=1 Tax=Alteromonas arenosi TaxID=3055817 RepID=A0ABT7SVU0_9ALTE|nr:LysR family transcriptional regulator [Alteromonas sp. ASW11-36]MDM7860283.1 LysR family transcriptional regulator [Alteromonas sp. ASW11-36]
MEDWNDYLLILALHRAGTLRGAAMTLATTHTTVSRRLEQLHRRHQGNVFEKSVGGYQITAFGEPLLALARRMEQVVVNAERKVSAADDALAGKLTLSIGEPMAQYLLLDELFAFTQRYPRIQLHINSSTRFADLDKSEADVVIRAARKLPEHLVGHRLFPYSICYYANPEYLASTPRNELRWIAPSQAEQWSDLVDGSPYPEAPIGITIDDIVTRFIALKRGQGLGRTACFLGDGCAELIRLPNTIPTPQVDIWVLTHPDLKDTPRVKLLMQYLTHALREKRALIQGEISR